MLKVGGWIAVFSRLVRLALIEKVEEGKEVMWEKGVPSRRNHQGKDFKARDSQEC